MPRQGHALRLCPTTEADLGDGFAPVQRLGARGISLCIGSDSNIRIDPLEELRELSGIARRQTMSREALGPEELLAVGTTGARALGLDVWPSIAVDLDHISLRGVAHEDVEAALVAGCSADVIV